MGTRRRRKRRERLPNALEDELLRNWIRQKIHELLEDRPGTNRRQLAVRLDVVENAVDFHVRRMLECGLLKMRREAHRRERLCFTRENVGLWEDPATRVFFGRGAPRQVARYLLDHPTVDVAEVSAALGLSPNTVRRHLNKLERVDLVQRLRVGRGVVYHADPDLRVALEQVGGGELWPS